MLRPTSHRFRRSLALLCGITLAITSRLLAAAPVVGTTDFDPLSGDIMDAGSTTTEVSISDFDGSGWDITVTTVEVAGTPGLIRGLATYGVGSTDAVQTGGVTFGGSDMLVSSVAFASNDGTEFKLGSFAINAAGGATDYTLSGYRDDVALSGAVMTGALPQGSLGGRSFTTIDVSGHDGFNNIDRFVVTFATPGSRFLWDNIEVDLAAPVPVPVITSGSSVSVAFGDTPAYTITTNGAGVSFSGTDLVPGVSVDAMTGELTGTAQELGTFGATLIAANAEGVEVSAPLTLSVHPANLPQSITFNAIGTQSADQGSLTLGATASSGLPINYTVVSGPATVSGSTLTFTGAGGTVTVRAAQAGNNRYAGAVAVTQSFEVRQSGQLVFFGTTSADDAFAVVVDANRTSGTLIGYLAGTSEGFVVPLALDGSGQFTATAATLVATDSTTANGASTSSPRTPARDTHDYTFSGALSSDAITGTISGVDLEFTGQLEAPAGGTAALAGYYSASALGNASGTTHAIVGTTGSTYLLWASPQTVAGGSGSIGGGGNFSATLPGDLTLTGNIDNSRATLSGTLARADGSESAFAGLAAGTTRTDRLVNISIRAQVDVAASGPLITGFVVGGDTPKHVLIRAIGPTLEDFGLTTAMPDPKITIYNAAGESVASVDDWSGDFSIQQLTSRLGAFPLDLGSKDAVAETQLPPGAYTVHIENVGAAGVALTEIYDASETPNTEAQRLVNISSRSLVSPGEGQLVGGFVVTGNSPKRILVRGVGPELATFNVAGFLTNPRLSLYDATETPIAENDDWETGLPLTPNQTVATAAEIAAAAQSVGGFPLTAGSQDAALIVTLNPGSYTVALAVATPDTAPGNGLIEIYELP
ncbi:hypothetical protein [Actomonas aquatica]|uniref:DUF4397 domain-containing protein n=1 Tax=Actomonas aquatica TaxID=2866162 RepID=A0ABZ1C691_9BACT|nr:hypothetical protein [Opitutus sp. WL0086]WRQ86049.1 hypothetical protein K1X11_014640 [Opitutus sp. WL0086]